MSNSSDTKRGAGCLMLFGAPFLAIGLFVLFWSVWHAFDWLRMQTWVETPATIVSASLEQHHDPEGGTTYQAVARYTYEYGGEQYTGNRVAVTGSVGDSVGNFQRQVAHELARYAPSRKPFRCYVNPSDPREAVLYRDFRLGLFALMIVFALVFGGVGGGLIGAAIYGARRLNDEGERKRLHPTEPWKWNRDWDAGRINSSTKAKMVFSTGFASLWNGISFPAASMAIPEILNDKFYLAPIVIIFPLVGLGLAVWAARDIWRMVKFGTSVFEMAAVPGVVGGPLGGVIHINRKLRPENGFLIQLSAIHEVTTSSGDSTSVSREILWHDTKRLGRELDGDSRSTTVLPVEFSIPFDAPATRDTGSDNEIIWRLEASADDRGLDYSAEFDVPVFQTDQSDPNYKRDTQALDGYLAPPDPQAALDAARIQVHALDGGGRQYTFPLGRQLGTALGLTLVTAILFGVSWATHQADTIILFPIMFGGFGLLFAFATLDHCLTKHTLAIVGDQVVLKGGWLGMGGAHSFRRGDIRNVTTRRGMQSAGKNYYDLALVTTDGQQRILGRRVGELSLSKEIAAEILAEIAGREQ